MCSVERSLPAFPWQRTSTGTPSRKATTPANSGRLGASKRNDSIRHAVRQLSEHQSTQRRHEHRRNTGQTAARGVR